MICFEVSLNGDVIDAANGDVIYTAGVPYGVLVLNLVQFSVVGDAECRLQVRGTPNKPAGRDDPAPRLQTALQHPERTQSVNQMQWEDRRVDVGDEFTVRIVDRTECDVPE
jgi:hypothetical protein